MKDWRYIDQKVWTNDRGESATYWILLNSKTRIFYYIVEHKENELFLYTSGYLHDLVQIMANSKNQPKVESDPLTVDAINYLITELKSKY